MSRLEVAKSFLNLAALGKIREAYEGFVAPDFIHHNQYFKGDRQSLLEAMEAAHRERPNKSLEIKHLYEDGDTVIAHSLVRRTDPKAPSVVVVHICRFKNEKIVEMWDVGQLLERDSPNENGPF